MVGVPVGPVLVMLAFGLAGEVGDVVAGLPEHAPVAQITDHVGPQQVRTLRLRVLVATRGGARSLPVTRDGRGGLEELLGDERLVSGVG